MIDKYCEYDDEVPIEHRFPLKFPPWIAPRLLKMTPMLASLPINLRDELRTNDLNSN